MYLPFWAMHTRPFEQTHNRALFVPYDAVMMAWTKLRYAIASHLGACAVIGPVGVGKTELLRLLLREQEEAGHLCAYISDPSGAPEDVLRLLGALLGASTISPTMSPLEALLRRLSDLGQAQKSVLLVVDDVHAAENVQTLEHLRMLLNLEFSGARVVNLILAGQGALDARLDAASGFSSHLALRVQLHAMTADDTRKYILFRLKHAGCASGIFTQHAADRIYALSGGVPRTVNRICELALTTAFGLQQHKIGPDVIDMAARDLGLVVSVATSGSVAEEDVLAGLGV